MDKPLPWSCGAAWGQGGAHLDVTMASLVPKNALHSGKEALGSWLPAYASPKGPPWTRTHGHRQAWTVHADLARFLLFLLILLDFSPVGHLLSGFFGWGWDLFIFLF